ncbi:MAG: U32 family peptidase [Bryobacterales bacterium]|nr:U32 family peptidase [Bryobacterales bacterium]MBV9398420.1 U32 family peptidase [Bryobacterales bacterium]
MASRPTHATLKVVKKPEILSPAGHWPQLQAAIDAGADAVYFGLTHFTARAKAGFTLAELPDALRTLHQRGVEGYVTYNSLVFDSELREASRGLAAIADAGADAIIVQDWAIVKLARQIAPDLRIYGSTQMSITNADGVRVAQSLGVDRVILARELSLEEIRAIRAQTDCELEIFVHGALCVSYSGQCFSSEAWGGRSANRGQCAQACRLPYETVVDGRVRPLGDARYLLSPGDLSALKHIPEILKIGIAGLKIEGRYKDENYVTLTTRAYRKAVDEAWAGCANEFDAQQERDLEQVYSRGLGPWFLTGTNHQAVVRGRSPRHRGLRMGNVVRVLRDAVIVESCDLKPGDGIVFDAADWRSPQEPEEGGRLYAVERAGDRHLKLSFANGAIDFSRIRPGDWVWRTHDPTLEKKLNGAVHKQRVRVRAHARENEPLLLEWTLERRPEISVEVRSPQPLGAAENRPLNEELLKEQLGRLGDSTYELAHIDLDIEGAPFAPASLLNQLRRQAAELLQARQISTNHRTVGQDAILRAVANRAGRVVNQPHFGQPAPQDPTLHLLVRTPEQLNAALSLKPASITLDYLDLYGLRPSLDRVKASGIEARVASPRVLKPGEDRIADFLLRCDCPILVRSAGLLDALSGRAKHGLTGDFSLNAANAITARELLERGLERLTPTHDLNAAQIAELAGKAGAGWIEVVAYEHLPVFHTEHCVFCRFLSAGTSFRDCGRPCETHRVELRDQSGRAHPVVADVGCRNTVFGAEAQEGSRHLNEWLQSGIRHFRLEFVTESAERVIEIVRAFDAALRGGMSPSQLQRHLREFAPQGIAEGSLFVPAPGGALPILQ